MTKFNLNEPRNLSAPSKQQSPRFAPALPLQPGTRTKPRQSHKKSEETQELFVSAVQSFVRGHLILLTDITLDPKLLGDLVQTDQGCVSNLSQNVGEDAGGFGAVMGTTQKPIKHNQHRVFQRTRSRCAVVLSYSRMQNAFFSLLKIS